MLDASLGTGVPDAEGELRAEVSDSSVPAGGLPRQLFPRLRFPSTLSSCPSPAHLLFLHPHSGWSLSGPLGTLPSCVRVHWAKGAAGIGAETSLTAEHEKKSGIQDLCSEDSEAEGRSRGQHGQQKEVKVGTSSAVSCQPQTPALQPGAQWGSASWVNPKRCRNKMNGQ